MKSKRIFISHISKETELAQFIQKKLDEDYLGMLDIFVSSDKESIKLGSNWLDQVEEALENTEIVIVLCSRESINRPWVNFEAGAAWIQKIPVIPICHSGLSTSELPSPLSMLQAVSGNKEGIEKLYENISLELGVKTPKTNYQEIITEFNLIEEKYIENNRDVKLIRNPKILCAASPFYSSLEMGFDHDIEILEKYFPNCVHVHKQLTKTKLITLLTSQQFDILHLVVGADEKNGDIVFSDMDIINHTPLSDGKEAMSSDSFAHLLSESNTKLVVLATCNALLLAVEVAKVSNMAASDTTIKVKDILEWNELFYELLSKEKSLYKTFEITKKMLPKIPVRAIQNHDLCFSIKDDTKN